MVIHINLHIPPNEVSNLVNQLTLYQKDLTTFLIEGGGTSSKGKLQDLKLKNLISMESLVNNILLYTADQMDKNSKTKLENLLCDIQQIIKEK